MASYTIVRSKTAILVGAFFTLVTAYVLLEDVFRHGAPFTTKHLMTLAVLAGTVYFGHRFWAEARAWRLGTSFGCAVLFLAGTGTCVLMSAGRNAEVVTNKALAANAINSGRQTAQKDRDEAKVRYQAALKAEEDECSTGNGAKCSAKRITRMVRREEYDEAEAKLRAEPPEKIANADVRAAADLLSHLPLVTATPESVEALLLLLYPFLQSLFCEIGAICGFAIGLGHQAVKRSTLDEPTDLPEAKPEKIAAPKIARLRKIAQAPAMLRVPSSATVIETLEKADRPLANYELAALIGCSAGECSRRVARMNGELHRERVGHCIMISLAKSQSCAR